MGRSLTISEKVPVRWEIQFVLATVPTTRSPAAGAVPQEVAVVAQRTRSSHASPETMVVAHDTWNGTAQSFGPTARVSRPPTWMVSVPCANAPAPQRPNPSTNGDSTECTERIEDRRRLEAR